MVRMVRYKMRWGSWMGWGVWCMGRLVFDYLDVFAGGDVLNFLEVAEE